ncbi:MAG: hypothetical protein B7733_05770 [Myxococcales bacterium FL481]|nr:MAG: hypothetical protein B7733_05770 [Myxococcales bacterium FL481]
MVNANQSRALRCRHCGGNPNYESDTTYYGPNIVRAFCPNGCWDGEDGSLWGWTRNEAEDAWRDAQEDL